MPFLRPTLLFVEDEALLRLTIGEELADAGFTVLQAGDAAAALEVLASDAHIDLLFTDVRMPGAISGWDLAAKARAMRPGLPIIYATGYSENLVQSLPGSRFLKKPYRLLALLEAARELGVHSSDDAA